ncbi:hypothetical protein C4K04_4408 [Pseudomonas chlororaphis]|uniref:Uncharacterized protein n=1 Tax=Pseudomonas chlororaphis TaxID=587753 RepID=A0A3G7TSH4_9PSED|nr:hypothetical protein C4K04_4408 [Pseudomonas chlororaphis]
MHGETCRKGAALKLLPIKPTLCPHRQCHKACRVNHRLIAIGHCAPHLHRFKAFPCVVCSSCCSCCCRAWPRRVTTRSRSNPTFSRSAKLSSSPPNAWPRGKPSCSGRSPTAITCISSG